MKTLSLDLGQSSIGWLIRDHDQDGIDQFRKFGVITFNKGVGEEKNVEYSLAAERTKYRSMRRLYQSRKYKLWETLKKLKSKDFCPIDPLALEQWSTYDKKRELKRKYPVWDTKFENWIKLDFDGDGQPDFESPYQLRRFLAENKLNFDVPSHRYMLGRALYHIAQHRAFKSSKKVNLDQDLAENTDIGVEEQRRKSFMKEFEQNGLLFDENKTIGQLLAIAEDFFKKRGYGRIRNELHPYITRKMLQKEVEQIFQFQFGSDWHNVFKDIFGVEKISKCSIFWQRPLRSQKSAVGKCTLEKNKTRCPAGHPEFEIYRSWSFINNIRYAVVNTGMPTEQNGSKDYPLQPLPLEIKSKLYSELFIQKNDFKVIEIKKWLMKELNAKNIVLNYKDFNIVSGSPTVYYLRKILGENWQNVKIEHPPIKRIKKNKSHEIYVSSKNYYTYEDIWHVAFQSDDEEELEEIARNKFKFDDNQVKQYLSLFKNMTVDYARYSLKAIRNINRFLQRGLIHSDAVLLAKIPEILGPEIFNEENENFLIDALDDIIKNNRKNKNIIQITNTIISDFKINHYHEKDFDYILQDDDIKKIEKECINNLGKSKWSEFNEMQKNEYIEGVKKELQAFIKDRTRKYRQMPKLIDELKQFLEDNFDFHDQKKLSKIYHHSDNDIYPELTSRDRHSDGKLYLQSPKTGAWKNPMAMRVLQEMRKLINYLIETDQIDENTRIVVEIPRELNDANKRKAYEIMQRRREQENEEFARAINELIKNNPAVKANSGNDSDIDKFRLWYEQLFDMVNKEFTSKGPNELKSQTKKNKKGEEQVETIFKENDYLAINSPLWFSLAKAKDNITEKYRLWNEQKAVCIYTGRLISLSDLFNEDTIDIEHTLPYSRSLDNSLANKTVCFKEYNRKIKQNKIPYECPNYDEILLRIQPWKEKIENIKKHFEYWSDQAKKAVTKERKNKCIIQKHLWFWELNYWKNKTERFEMKEITQNFVNAQLVETQIISKYAFHYLKTLFENVQVQKGTVTSDFAKIIGLRDKYKPKIRDKHSHHVLDAFVLSLIPDSARLKKILEMYAEKSEIETFLKDGVYDSDTAFQQKKRVELLDKELNDLLIQSRVPINSIHKIARKIENEVLSITPVRHKIFATAKKRIKHGRLKGKYAAGDVVRGQLHKESFYGKIKLVERDENGKPLRDPNTKEWIWKTNKNGEIEYSFVKRVPVDDKLDIDKIVDPEIKKIFKRAIEEEKISLKEMAKQGGLIYTDPKTGQTKRIRHVRCFQKPTELLEIKKQTYLSKHDYKNFYYADNAENLYYALYEDENGKRTFEMLNLFHAIEIKKKNRVEKLEDFFPPYKEVGRGKKTSIANLKAILYPKQKVIFYKESIDELKDLSIDQISRRMYNIYSLYGKYDGRIQFQHHLEARADKDIKNPDDPSKKLIGFSSIDFDNLQPRYLLSLPSFNFAIEGKDFEIKPDGTIVWKF